MDFIRLIEIEHPQELTLVKLALTKENIEYRVLFEKTMEVASVYALGNHGAIIEVPKEDYQNSKAILLDLGIDLDYDKNNDRFEFIEKMEENLGKYKFIRKISEGYRFLTFSLISAIIIFLIILINTNRISKNEIIGHSWCVEKIIHQGKELKPNTESGVFLTGLNRKCKEDIFFHDSGMINLPGFNSFGPSGRWTLKTEKRILISNMRDFKDIYEGEYLIKTNLFGTMQFVSDKTIIEISRKY